MVKKAAVMIEELASDSEGNDFDGEFDGDFSDNSSEGPQAVNLKDAKLRFEKSLPQKKTKKITKSAVQIRGGDIFA